MNSIRNFLMFGFLVCNCTYGISQGNTRSYIKSIRMHLAEARNDSATMVSYLDLGKFYIDIDNDSSMLFAQKAYLISLQIKSQVYEAQCLDFMGAVAVRRGNSDQAVEFLLKGVKLFEDQKDSTFLIVANRNLGSLYKGQQDYTRAREYYARSLRITPRKPDDSLFYSWALMDMGDLLMSLNNPDSALYFAQRSTEMSSTLPSPYRNKYQPLALNTVGRIYELSGKHAAALEKYQQAVSMAFANFNMQAVSDNYMAMAMLFRKAHSIDSGFYYAKKAFEIAKQVNNPLAIENSSSYLKDYFKDKHLLDSAFVYQEIMGQAKDSLLNLEKIRQVQNYSFNEQLKQEEIKTKLTEYRNNEKLYFLLGGFIVVLIIALLLLINNRQKQKAKNNIEKAYRDLKTTQSQLIQSEKMASLGEMTAGIAHEIQNPLNFVNNFSEVNVELSEELKAELDNVDISSSAKSVLMPLVDTLMQNQGKILHHGKRADAIVKGMLLHSRASSGQKESTDLNALVSEYFRLSYNGMRAKDPRDSANKAFNASMQINLDPAIASVNIIPQDIGRVLLNIFNNAFYAVSQLKLQTTVQHEPTVSVTTKKLNGKVEIIVKDNGQGIPKNIQDKIFQPFFTTKPTGQGTGLGLSLSYDIVKSHGGEIKLVTAEGVGTEFIVLLPI